MTALWGWSSEAQSSSSANGRIEGHLQPSAFRTDIRLHRTASRRKSLLHPRGVRTVRQPSTADVQRQRHGLKLAGPTLVQRDEPQEPKIVPEDRIDGVVVDEAPEIEQHAS